MSQFRIKKKWTEYHINKLNYSGGGIALNLVDEERRMFLHLINQAKRKKLKIPDNITKNRFNWFLNRTIVRLNGYKVTGSNLDVNALTDICNRCKRPYNQLPKHKKVCLGIKLPKLVIDKNDKQIKSKIILFKSKYGGQWKNYFAISELLMELEERSRN